MIFEGLEYDYTKTKKQAGCKALILLLVNFLMH